MIGDASTDVVSPKLSVLVGSVQDGAAEEIDDDDDTVGDMVGDVDGDVDDIDVDGD